MCRVLLVPLTAIGLAVAGSTSSQPIHQQAKSFDPFSKTAIAITGPVKLSTNRMTFESGEFLDLDLVDQAATGVWGVSGDRQIAQIFHVSGDVGTLRYGNTLCGDQLVTFMAFWDEKGSGFQYLGVAMFTGNEAPDGVADPSHCATFFYVMDAIS